MSTSCSMNVPAASPLASASMCVPQPTLHWRPCETGRPMLRWRLDMTPQDSKSTATQWCPLREHAGRRLFLRPHERGLAGGHRAGAAVSAAGMGSVRHAILPPGAQLKGHASLLLLNLLVHQDFAILNRLTDFRNARRTKNRSLAGLWRTTLSPKACRLHSRCTTAAVPPPRRWPPRNPRRSRPAHSGRRNGHRRRSGAPPLPPRLRLPAALLRQSRRSLCRRKRSCLLNSPRSLRRGKTAAAAPASR